MIKRRFLAVLLLGALSILTACSAKPYAAAPSSSKATQNPAVESTATPDHVADGSITDTWETKGNFVPQPATTTTIETYQIAPGTEMETDVSVLTAAKEGPTLYIVASVHGDEIAGYTAANQLKNMELNKGKLYLISPANVLGAQRNDRYVVDNEDLNRAFPGDPSGNQAQQLADCIYKDIEKVKPGLVLDLHEARIDKENRDFLGSSLIYTSLDGMEDLFLDMQQATVAGTLCSQPFNFFSPGPVGSINNVVSSALKIPVITIETYRAYPLERRVEDQLALIGYILHYNEML